MDGRPAQHRHLLESDLYALARRPTRRVPAYGSEGLQARWRGLLYRRYFQPDAGGAERSATITRPRRCVRHRPGAGTPTRLCLSRPGASAAGGTQRRATAAASNRVNPHPFRLIPTSMEDFRDALESRKTEPAGALAGAITLRIRPAASGSVQLGCPIGTHRASSR